MTVDGIASLVNTMSIGIVLAASAFVGRHYPATVFRAWTRGYVGFFTMLLLESFSTTQGRMLSLDLVELAVYAASASSFVDAGTALADRASSLVERAGSFILVLVAGATLRLSGLSFEVAIIPGVLAVSVAYVRLGVGFIRHRQPDGTGTAWIGVPLIALGALPLLYPLLVKTSVSWLGYLLATSLHLSVGFGMIVHVLERHTEAVRVQHEALDQLRDDFVASVSHELRTPVTAVKAAVRMLAAGLLGPMTVEQRNYIDIIARSSDRLHCLVNDLLDLAEAQAGALRFTLAPTDVAELVDDVLEGVRLLAVQSGITLSSRVEPALFVDTDGARLAQVLLNLVSNAVKFTPRGGAVVVDVSRRERDVCFQVRDTGPGISAADQSRLFSKFFRVGGVNTRPAGGTGLGLVLSKRIVEDGLKGAIWVESRIGQGSSFYVSIPAAPADRAPLTDGGG